MSKISLPTTKCSLPKNFSDGLSAVHPVFTYIGSESPQMDHNTLLDIRTNSVAGSSAICLSERCHPFSDMRTIQAHWPAYTTLSLYCMIWHSSSICYSKSVHLVLMNVEQRKQWVYIHIRMKKTNFN